MEQAYPHAGKLKKEFIMNPIFEFFVMQIVLVAVVLLLHTYMGLHIIRRGIIFSDLVLDQLAALGMVVGIGFGISYGSPLAYLLSLVAVLVGCGLLAAIRPDNKKISQEVIIGILYGMALIASLMLADKIPEGGSYLGKTLAGSMLWVSWSLIGITTLSYLALALLHFIFRKHFLKLTEAPHELKRYTLWNFMFFVTQGIITILIVPVAGVLLAYGFLMIPAAIGTLFSRNWGAAMLIGWGAGFTACLVGITYSYQADSPYGPTLLLSMGLFFMIALILRAVISRSKRRVS